MKQNLVVSLLAVLACLSAIPSMAESPDYTLGLAANSNKCLQKKDPGWDNGNPIHLWDCGVEKNNESWVYDSKTGQIRAKANPKKCLQKKDPGWDNGNPIHLWDCGVEKDNESWLNTIFVKVAGETSYPREEKPFR
ncbi:MAG: RICIN domain-containing protein [Leptolyngbyaceae cyanobacterium bins.59]|nr:RICIN domain-containing protein [Leptolyngbyaceae cyanobacterium bins.59]